MFQGTGAIVEERGGAVAFLIKENIMAIDDDRGSSSETLSGAKK